MENIKVDVIPQEETNAILDWLKDWKDKMMSEMEDEITVPKEKLEKLKELDWYMSIQGKLLN